MSGIEMFLVDPLGPACWGQGLHGSGLVVCSSVLTNWRGVVSDKPCVGMSLQGCLGYT